MAFFLLLFGLVLSLNVAGIHANLQCTNDYERMFCQLKLKNCHEYELNLQSDSGNMTCSLRQCGPEQCYCNVEMTLIFGETHTATVRKGEKSLESKTILVTESFKPKTPAITSVDGSNGNFGVSWWTNMENHTSIPLTAELVYYKKGDTATDWKAISPAIVKGQQYYEISGQHLEWSTTYVVRVRSVSELNHRLSDISNEWEFKTPASCNTLFFGIIVGLCLAVIIISIAMYCCYVKLKNDWWDKLPNPKILIVHPVKDGLLQPEKSRVSPICVDQLIPNGNQQRLLMPFIDSIYHKSECSSTDSSHLSYADTHVDITTIIMENLSRIFPSISLVPQRQTSQFTSKDSGLFSAPLSPDGIRFDGSTSGSSELVNHSYSLICPNSSNSVSADSPEVQMQTEQDYDLHDSSKSMIMSIFGQDVSPHMSVDMYQQYNTDPQKCSYAEDSSLSSISSGTDMTTSCEPETRVENSDKFFHPASTFSSLPNKNPFHESHIILEDNYQQIQNLVAQPGVLFSEERSSDQEGDLGKYQEKPFSKIPQNCLNPFFQDVGNDAPRCLSQHKFQTPFLLLMSADNGMPVNTESAYHSV
ncbi:uncharacterized protein LOC121645215 isoform X2 [Melanotaenia boesemani]|uniref:uncharacterized protein LOC121645215 isoform X2 n=1 Tax=Melanotaenia boesemani TaxID=1250792 RepID=UPI001C051955|nr:uncharacterized protein LOC121645215 isoform X2 [Melanotaenia boesemani]